MGGMSGRGKERRGRNGRKQVPKERMEGNAQLLSCNQFFFIVIRMERLSEGFPFVMSVTMETKAPGRTESSYRRWLHAVSLLCLHRRVKNRLPGCVAFETPR